MPAYEEATKDTKGFGTKDLRTCTSAVVSVVFFVSSWFPSRSHRRLLQAAGGSRLLPRRRARRLRGVHAVPSHGRPRAVSAWPPTARCGSVPRRSCRSPAAASCRRGRSSRRSGASRGSGPSPTRSSRRSRTGWPPARPKGTRRTRPRLPAFPDGWLLGTPDLIVTLPEPFVLQADPTDAFRIFAIPLPVSKRVPGCVASSSIPATPAWCTTPTSAWIARRRTRLLDDAGPAARLRRPDAADRPSIPTGTSWAGRPARWRRSWGPTWRGRSSPAATSSCSCTCSRRERWSRSGP